MDTTIDVNRQPDQEKDESEDFIEEEVIIPPDGGWGWIVLISGFFAHVLSDGVMYAFGVILEELMTVFNAKPIDVTFVGSLLPAVILGIGPVASTLITLFGARAITIAGSVIAGVFLVISAFGPESLVFLSISIGVLCGIGFGIIYLPAIVMVSYYFEKRRSFAMGLTVAGSGVGTVAFPPLLRLLIKHYEWRGTFLILGSVVFNCIACGLVLLPLKPTKIRVPKRQSEDDKNFSLLDAINEENKNRPMSPKAPSGVNGQLAMSLDENEDASETRDILATSPELNPLLQNSEAQMVASSFEHLNFRRGISLSPNRPYEDYEHNRDRFRRFSQTEEERRPMSAISTPRLHPNRRHNALHRSQHLPSHGRNPDLLHRPDLLYPASLTHIPLYASNRDLFVHQMSHYASEASIPDKFSEAEEFEEKKTLFTKMTQSLRQSFDFTLFKDIPFLIFCISSFMTSLGYNAPYLFIVAWGTNELHFSKAKAALLSSFIGVGNIIGRLFFGFVGDLPRVSRMMLYIVALILCGFVTVLSPFYTAYWWMVAYSLLFGILIGAYVSLTPLLIVDLLGLHRLEVAFGILGLVQCIATLIGPPLLAYLQRISNSFDMMFWACGAVIGLSGLMLLPVYFCYKNIRTNVTYAERALGRAETLAGRDDEGSTENDASDDTHTNDHREAQKI